MTTNACITFLHTSDQTFNFPHHEFEYAKLVGSGAKSGCMRWRNVVRLLLMRSCSDGMPSPTRARTMDEHEVSFLPPIDGNTYDETKSCLALIFLSGLLRAYCVV
jgi:hypothetical protein